MALALLKITIILGRRPMAVFARAEMQRVLARS